MGGRKPAKELHLSPEEEERRRIRRERNKAAAARCRKRRVDHTNALIEVSSVVLSTYIINSLINQIRKASESWYTFIMNLSNCCTTRLFKIIVNKSIFNNNIANDLSLIILRKWYEMNFKTFLYSLLLFLRVTLI